MQSSELVYNLEQAHTIMRITRELRPHVNRPVIGFVICNCAENLLCLALRWGRIALSCCMLYVVTAVVC